MKVEGLSNYGIPSFEMMSSKHSEEMFGLEKWLEQKNVHIIIKAQKMAFKIWKVVCLSKHSIDQTQTFCLALLMEPICKESVQQCRKSSPRPKSFLRTHHKLYIWMHQKRADGLRNFELRETKMTPELAHISPNSLASPTSSDLTCFSPCIPLSGLQLQNTGQEFSNITTRPLSP
ncbi:hypothetical protein TNCV_5062291 [Trichonephila clavipes]|nr:hypothetical protein TNCV_5062291 [Trichonephila clavipes]